ncbi:kinesin-like protein KIFC3 isoform X2 [Patella vulgata]|uniref:kinesin-like protein KIFC3 isoform X2 n=1 Tax=Patella vulgata TaxID=6465 RepID=UPI002180529A|nr:kinesin-like protein KIFC3 isoform X2 [Patella vulgata]
MVYTMFSCRYSYGCTCGFSSNQQRRKLYISSIGGEERSPAEYASLQQALKERNTQRDDLLLKIKNLTDKNKVYKTQLEKDDLSQKQLQKILQKSHETQLAERETLLTNLQEIIAEHETKILSLEEQIHGNISNREDTKQAPETKTGSSKLIEQIRQLQQEKSELFSELATVKLQVEICERDHVETITSLQENLSKIETDNSRIQDDLLKLKNKDNIIDIGIESINGKNHLNKIQTDRFKKEIGKYHVRASSIGFSSENEQIQILQEENERLEELLSGFQSKLSKAESTLSETETKYREELLNLSKENQKISRLLRDTKADVTCLQAREPEVMTKIERVEVEVESQKLNQKLSESQKEKSTLEADVQDWKEKYTEAANEISELQEENKQYLKQLQKNVTEVIDMEEKHEQIVEELKEEREKRIQEVKDEVEEEMKNLRLKNSMMHSKISAINLLFEQLVESHRLLRKQASQFPHVLAVTIDTVKKEAIGAIEDINKRNQELVDKYHREMKLRKKYHNELVELRGNIRVFCRVRPTIKEDGISSSSQIVVTFDPYDDGLLFIANKSRSQVFEMDKVFNENSSQTEVFEEVRSIVTSCVDGYNVCIFAYGQTGSGKTYTMEGPVSDPGINQRALIELFNETRERGTDWEYTISVSVLEIYNENIRDLLNRNDDGSKLEIKMKSDGGGLYVPGLSTIQVTSLNQVNQVFMTGQKNRATATTNLNEHSSRSHALLCIEVTGLNRTTNTRTKGKLNLVDLAGSERVSKSGADGTRLKEAQNINKSLSCLGDVIHSLRSKQNHVPYRNSKLTYLLQDSLGGDSKTLMIVQASPAVQNVSETICTLNFAQRVRTVQLGSATRQLETGDINENTLSTPSRSPLPHSPYNSPALINKTPSNNKTPLNNKTTSNNKTPISARRALTPRNKPK